MLKLKAEDNVLAIFLSQQNLSARELTFLKPCGSDGAKLYTHGRELIDINHLESTSLQTIPKRLRHFQNVTLPQGLLYIFFAFSAPWLWSYVESYLPKGFQTYLWILSAIYICVDVLIGYIKQRQHPKVHYQLMLHTRFGEQYAFAQAENQETLLQLKSWLQNHKPTAHPFPN